MTNSRRKRKQKRNGRICISLIAIMFLVIMSVQIVKLYQKEQECQREGTDGIFRR